MNESRIVVVVEDNERSGASFVDCWRLSKEKNKETTIILRGRDQS